MTEQTQEELIQEVIARFVEPAQNTLLGASYPALDVSKANIHDSKAEFLAEKTAVETAARNANELFEFVLSAIKEDHDDFEAMSRVGDFIDANARGQGGNSVAHSAIELVRDNVRNIGLTYSTAMILVEVLNGLHARNQELVSQEAIFWNVSSRPPNYYARTIALRFAKLIARHTGKRPTFGTSRDGTHPSTDFGRALEDIFVILEINAHVTNAAKWALKQLNEEDLKPPRNALMGFGGTDQINQPTIQNFLMETYGNAPKKGGRK